MVDIFQFLLFRYSVHRQLIGIFSICINLTLSSMSLSPLLCVHGPVENLKANRMGSHIRNHLFYVQQYLVTFTHSYC